MGPNLMDEIDCGNFFDQIDDLIEFPLDNECSGNLASSDTSNGVPSMWEVPLPDCGPLFPGSHDNASTNAAASDLSAELSVPYEDIVQLEWLSTFVEDSFSGGGLTVGKDALCANKEPLYNQFQTSSPVSVLESSSSSSSSSSCSAEKIMQLTHTHRGPQRARSKRPRPATFNPRPAIHLISSPSSSSIEPPQPFITPGLSSESVNFAKSLPVKKISKLAGAEPKKKKKIKTAWTANEGEDHQNPLVQAVRKCLHCEIAKTPQWRAGPMGPKTLCNACGVRYKSGRLFPEYRPAASPTFVPSVHSNSHKKVLEMRSKAVVGSPATPKSELI